MQDENEVPLLLEFLFWEAAWAEVLGSEPKLELVARRSVEEISSVRCSL